MIWDDFVKSIRIDMGDNSTPPKYSNELICSYFRSAIWDVSMYFPLRFDHVALVVSADDAKKFALPSNFIEEVMVECPRDTLLSLRRDRPGTKRAPANSPMFYELDGSHLYLDADPGSFSVLLSYYGVHGLPEGAGDVNSILTVPDRDLELVALYVKALINQRERTRQSSLDRFKLGTGDRLDNPIAPEVEDYFREYRNKVAERSGGTIFLQRTKRYRR
jgi:hypothetical protein